MEDCVSANSLLPAHTSHASSNVTKITAFEEVKLSQINLFTLPYFWLETSMMKRLKPKYFNVISCNWAFIGRCALFLERKGDKLSLLDTSAMNPLVV